MNIEEEYIQKWINNIAKESLVLIGQPLPDLTQEELDRVSTLENNLEKIEILSRTC